MPMTDPRNLDLSTFRFKDVPDNEKWKMARGTLWRGWVLVMAGYLVVLVVLLLIVAAIAVLGGFGD
jgi:hypothetical protein